MDPLYPVGYPSLLAVGKLLAGDVLLVAKAVSVAAGVGAVACALAMTTRTGGGRTAAAVVSAWVLAQPGVLQWGTTEGTDLPAAVLCIAGILLAEKRPTAAGALVGAACLCRYTAVAAVPVVLVLARDRRAILALVLATLPHFVGAALAGTSPLPHQDENLTIANGTPAALFSAETIRRWPIGFARAAMISVRDWPSWVGMVGMCLGAARRDRLAMGLIGFGLIHSGLLGLAFVNPRLALPTTLAVAFGVAWLVRWRLGLATVLVVTAASLYSHLPAAYAVDKAAAGRATFAAELPPGPWLATSPWLHERRDGWLIPTIQLSGLGMGRDVDTATVAAAARREGAAGILLEGSATRREYVGLRDLYDKGDDSFVLVAQRSGYRAYAVDGGGGVTPR